MSKIKKWKLMGLMVLASYTAKAQDYQPKDNYPQQFKTEQTAKKSSAKKRFDSKHLASACVKSGLDKDTSFEFFKNYLNHVDEHGAISVKDFMKVFAETDLSTEEAQNLWENIKKAQDDTKPKGYNIGSYDFSFSLTPAGGIRYFNMKSDKQLEAAALKEINEARCRHLGLAVDGQTRNIEASELLCDHLVYNAIKEKQAKGEKILYGDEFINNFNKKLDKNGLEIGKNGRLQGIEASRNKKLKTENDLYREYLQAESAKRKAFENRF